MSAKRPVSLGDIVGAMFQAPTKPAPSEPSNPPPVEVRQIVPPSAEELKEIQDLADEMADLHDQIEDLVGSKAAEFAAKKAELRERMLGHGLKEVAVPGRNPIVLATKREKEVTKKAITGLLGVEETAKLWASLPVKTSHYISIPPRNPPEA